MDLTLNFTLTPEDLDEFLARTASLTKHPLPSGHFLPKPSLLHHPLRGWTLFTVVLVVGFIIFVSLHQSPTHPVPTPAPSSSHLLSLALNVIPYLAILLLIWFFLFRQATASRGKAILRRNPESAQPQSAHLTDDAFIGFSSTAELRIQWQHFYHFYETPNLFLLRDKSKNFRILPKRAFPDPATLDAFRTLLHSKISLAPRAFPIIPIT